MKHRELDAVHGVELISVRAFATILLAFVPASRLNHVGAWLPIGNPAIASPYPFHCRQDLLKGRRTHVTSSLNRREVVQVAAQSLIVAGSIPSAGQAAPQPEVADSNMGKSKVVSTRNGGKLYDVLHEESGYPALIYLPPSSDRQATDKKLPVLIVLHGAGKNELDVWNLADPNGEHAGLAPSLLASGKAPKILAEEFIVVAPYSYKKRSFYEDPRGSILKFIKWVQESGDAGISQLVDSDRLFLFGFSDGSTVGVELMTTRRFRGGVFAAYGFTGDLPSLALQKLKDLNMWIFHSQDDVIFPVKCSDNLVSSLRKVNSKSDAVRYTRFEMDQEGFTGSVKGHSTGITASKMPQIYEWMLAL